MSRRSIQEYLGVPANWPVVETIKHEVVIMPNKEDIRTAKKKDPRACALHNAACRMFNVPSAAIGGRWAYIPQRNSYGKPYIARMQATKQTQRAIAIFDKTGKMPEGGFHFIPIGASHHTKYKRRYNRLYAKGKVGGNGKKRTPKYGAQRTARLWPHLEVPEETIRGVRVAR